MKKIILSLIFSGAFFSVSAQTINVKEFKSVPILHGGWNKYNHKQPEQYTSIHNPAGRLKTITLPDGSRVFLNAATTIRFPSHFTSVNREVTLVGEPYFEVKHDPEKPFLVNTGKMQI